MTEPSFTRVTAERSREAAERRAFVDVGNVFDPQILRNGIPVGVHITNPDVVTPILTEPIIGVKVIAQSIAPGTPVPEGTEVNLVLVRAARLPVGVIRGVHEATATLTMDDALARLITGNPLAERLASRAAAGQLTDADRQSVSTLFTDAGIEISTTPGRDVTAAVETLRTLVGFRDASR